jgi:glycerate dehydrogenase
MESVGFTDELTLFRQADFVSLHCPLNAQNIRFVNRALLRQMKPSAFLINTSRGQLIAEQELADALNEGVIAGAGLDVLSSEPPPADNPLLGARNCTVTPHIGWSTLEARSRLMETVVSNISAYLAGHPVNKVS